MNSIFKNLSIGAVGLTASAVAPDVLPSTPEAWGEIMQVLSQLVIVIATLVGLFKKKK